MATVEKPGRLRDVAEASRRVLDPLKRLRTYIRLYVSLEAAAIVLLSIIACFWISLVFDYGLFKIPFLQFDLVQQMPWSSLDELRQASPLAEVVLVLVNMVRLLPLVGLVFLVLLLIASKAINRLIQRFRDVALALELERRFPKILGDRLITAIELANRRKVVEQGYSAAMVDETIVEAAERVEKLPIKEVFRWGRLWFMGALILVLTVGLYLVTATAFAAVDSLANGGQGLLAGYSDYNEVLGIWFERNVLLQNTIWPRKAHLVIVEPEDGVRFGRDRQPPQLRVRAWKYTVADSRAREGWRLLTWDDLKTQPGLLGDPLRPDAVDLKQRDARVGLSVDEVDLFFANAFNIRKGEPTADGKFLFRTGKDGKTVTTTELPYQWAVLAAGNEWRPLAWKDVKKTLTSELFNDNNDKFTVPDLPKNWPAPLEPALGYTVEEVEREMAKSANHNDDALSDVRSVLETLNRFNDMRKTLDRVDDRIDEGSLRRTMRRLIVPATVTVTIDGQGTRSSSTLNRTTDYDYLGTFSADNLKGKKGGEAWVFTYQANGEDYSTPKRTITVVPPPTLTKLYREDARPAYRYYRAGKENVQVEDLKGKKQPFARAEVALSGGDVVTLDCPAGTDLTLIGDADKALQSVRLLAPADAVEPAPVVILDSPTTFRFTLLNVRQDRFFDMEMVDTDNVTGKRKLRIRATRDNEPSNDVIIADWVRKNKDGSYVVTPRARIPFGGKIKDDVGLSQIHYVYNVAQIESSAPLEFRALSAVGGATMMAPPGGALQGLTYLAKKMNEYEKIKAEQAPDNNDVKYFPENGVDSLAGFEAALKKEYAHEFLSPTKIQELMAQPQPSNFRILFHEFNFDPDKMTKSLEHDAFVNDFPMTDARNNKKERLLAKSGEPQFRYRVTLWVEATDNDLDSSKAVDGVDGPKTAASKNRYTFTVVSEEELNGLIGQDEAQYSDSLSSALDRLQEARDKLSVLIVDLNSAKMKEDLEPLSVRTESLEGLVDTASGTSRDVRMKYEALFNELKGNDFQSDKPKIVLNEIVRPLEDIDKIEFPDAKAKFQNLRLALDAKGAFAATKADANSKAVAAAKEMQELIEQMQKVLDKMQKQVELNVVVEKLRKVKEEEERIRLILVEIYKQREQQLLDDATKGTNP